MEKNTAARRAGGALLLAICLFISLKTVFTLFSVDEDTAHSLILWTGTKAWGLQSLRQFEFTPDNWLLSVVPLNFLLFVLLGAKPWVIILSGWLSYAASALLSAWIAWELQAKRAALALAASLSCLGLYALTSGFVAYAASHNVTNSYGLLVLLLALKFLRRPGVLYLLAITGLSAVAAISDPWMFLAYELPLFGLAALGAIRPVFGIPRARLLELALAVLAAIILGETRLFGVFDFIPGERAEPASLAVMAHNALFLLRDLGGMLNLFPGQKSNALLPAALSLLAIALAFGAMLAKTRHSVWQAPPRRFFAAFAVASIALLSAFFVLMNLVAASYSARFLMNLLYLIVIAFAITTELGWRSYGPALRAVSGLVGAGFFAAALTSSFPFWSNNEFVSQDSAAVTGIISFLESNGLAYGFGPYHGSHSNAVTVASENAVLLRPAMFDPQTGMLLRAPRFETYDRWLTPADVPAKSTAFFVFLNADGEECADLSLCETGLVRQFGPPARILRYSQTSWIYVWPRAMLSRLYAAPADLVTADPARGREADGEAAHPRRHSLGWIVKKLAAYLS